MCKVFLSHSYPDKPVTNLLRGWESDLDARFIVPEGAEPLRNGHQLDEGVSHQIEESDCMLVLVGDRTFRSEAVAREIEHGRRLDLPIIAVKTSPGNVTPKSLYGANAHWAREFTVRELGRALGAGRLAKVG
jgi:hypothetical protein